MYYRLVLCGLLLGLLIVGYSQPLHAEGLIYDDESSDTVGEAGESDILYDSVVSSESDEISEVSDLEYLEDSYISSESGFDVDPDDITDTSEDLQEEGMSDSDNSVDYSIDYDALSEVIVDSIVTASEELTTLEDESYSGSISSTYQEQFVSWYLKFGSPTDDYLCYRGDQYDYYLIIGDLTVVNTTFSGSGCTIVHLYTRTGTGYTPTVSVYTDDILITADLFYSFSNLGDFCPLPGLASLMYEQILVFLAVFILLFLFVDSLIMFRRER